MVASLSPLSAPHPSSANEHPEPRRSSVCQIAINLPRNLYQCLFRRQPQKNSPQLIEYAGPDRLSALYNDAKSHIFSFLRDSDLQNLILVNRALHSSMSLISQKLINSQKFIPESLPSDVNHKQFLFNKFPNAIKADFYQEHFGEVGIVPPVPRCFIEMAPRPGFKLIFIPEYITITVGPNSPLMLDETTAVNGKKARLIEDPKRAPQGQARKIIVPVTSNNMILLAQKYLKKNHSSQFGGISEYSWKNVLNQNGDIGVGRPHWSYQKEDVVRFGKYEGLEIVPLCDRILFHLLSYIKSGKIPAFVERTSTIVNSNNGQPWPSSIGWPVSGPVFHLSLFSTFTHFSFGDAAQVQIPAGSSQAIGH